MLAELARRTRAGGLVRLTKHGDRLVNISTGEVIKQPPQPVPATVVIPW